jgi:hypothetical protein
MKKQPFLQQAGFHGLAFILFIVLSYAYLFPLLEGKVIAQHDIQSHVGMSKELVDYRETTGEEAVWTNSMFGGMPGYMISVVYNSNLFSYLQGAFRTLFHPAAMLILYMLGFYILLYSVNIKKWLAIAGSVAFGFSSYHLIIIAAGHNSKAYAIGYLVIVVAGVLMAYRHDRLKGALLLAVGLAFEIMAGHLQITYYGLLTLLVFGISELIYAVKENRLPGFFKTTGYLIAGAMVAVAINFSFLYTTYEYSKETIRGKSELTHDQPNQTSGLDKDYVVQWSQGIDETLTLLIPNFKGGSHSTYPGPGSESLKALNGRVENPSQVINQLIMYHGDKPFTSGPYYAGALVIFLFVLGLFVVKGADKWWLVAATLMSVILAWGKYIMPLTSFLLDYLPLYNKFRAPEMTLIIAGFTIPLLGFLGLRDILSGKVQGIELKKAMIKALGITGGITLLFALIPGIAGDFSAPFDGAYPEWLSAAIVEDRMGLLRADAFRSFMFVMLGALTLFLWHLKKIKKGVLLGILGFLILADLWMVDKRYLGEDQFVTKRESANVYQTTVADMEILKDIDLSYRVLPLQNPWQDARASYFHKNVGGYHAAKLRRYQEMIEHHLSPEMDRMVEGLSSQRTTFDVFANLPALNMLNTKYIIYDLNSPPIQNSYALGNAWFIGQYKIVPDADAEIEALAGINPGISAVIDQRFEEMVKGKTFVVDSMATIKLTTYQPNRLSYAYTSQTEQMAVFSEIYYEDGWKAFVDGKETPHFRANYILRSMVLPAGSHEVEFRFEPDSFYLGNKVSMAGSLILILLIAGFVFSNFRTGKKSSL